MVRGLFTPSSPRVSKETLTQTRFFMVNPSNPSEVGNPFPGAHSFPSPGIAGGRAGGRMSVGSNGYPFDGCSFGLLGCHNGIGGRDGWAGWCVIVCGCARACVNVTVHCPCFWFDLFALVRTCLFSFFFCRLVEGMKKGLDVCGYLCLVRCTCADNLRNYAII